MPFQKTTFLVFFFLLLHPILIMAQDNQLPAAKNNNTFDYYIQAGTRFLQDNIQGSLTEFKTLAPQSVLLKQNLAGYTQAGINSSAGVYGSTVGVFSAGIGIRLSPEKIAAHKISPELRINFSYYSGDGLRNSYSKQVDTSTTFNYYMNYLTQQLRLDIAVIYGKDPNAHFSFYGGYGASIGLVINAYTTISYSDSTTSNFHSETFNDKKGSFNYALFFPLGIDLKISERRAFWNHVHFCFELRPTFSINSIPELKTTINKGLYTSLGLKFSLD